MQKTVAIVALMFFALGMIPMAAADMGSFMDATKDKTLRGIENGVFGLGGELYHSTAKHEKGLLHGMTLGLFDGLNKGVKRTVVGAYELATPFFHDEPLLSDLDTLGAS